MNELPEKVLRTMAYYKLTARIEKLRPLAATWPIPQERNGLEAELRRCHGEVWRRSQNRA